MHFNININLDKAKRGQEGEVTVEEGSTGGSPNRGSVVAAIPPVGGGRQFGYQQQQVAEVSEVQTQAQLRELYSKFALHQQKVTELNNELLEVRAQLLKKEEEVLARDQIIAVLTHSVKSKDKDARDKTDEIDRLKREISTLKQNQHTQQQQQQQQQQQHQPTDGNNLGEMVIQQQFKIMQQLIENSPPRDGSARRHSSKRNTLQSEVTTSQRPDRRSLETYQRRSLNSAGMSIPTSQGAYEPCNVLNTAVQYPGETAQFGDASTDKRASTVAELNQSYPSIQMSESVSENASDTEVQRSSMLTELANQVGAGIQGGLTNSNRNSLQTSKRSSLPPAPSKPQPAAEDGDMNISMSGASSRRNSHGSKRSSLQVAPAAKMNTAIALSNDEVELSEGGPSCRSSLQVQSRRSSTQAPAPATKPNTAITLANDEIELSEGPSRRSSLQPTLSRKTSQNSTVAAPAHEVEADTTN